MNTQSKYREVAWKLIRSRAAGCDDDACTIQAGCGCAIDIEAALIAAHDDGIESVRRLNIAWGSTAHQKRAMNALKLGPKP